MFGNNHSHDLVCALEDHVNARVAKELLHRVVFEIAVAAVKLQGLMANVKASLGGKQLGH